MRGVGSIGLIACWFKVLECRWTSSQLVRFDGMVGNLQEEAIASWVAAGRPRGRCMSWARPSCSMYVAGWPLAMDFQEIWRILAQYGLIHMVEVWFGLTQF